MRYTKYFLILLLSAAFIIGCSKDEPTSPNDDPFDDPINDPPIDASVIKVEGLVKNADGSAKSGVRIRLTKEDPFDGDSTAQQTTGSDGTFSFTSLPKNESYYIELIDTNPDAYLKDESNYRSKKHDVFPAFEDHYFNFTYGIFQYFTVSGTLKDDEGLPLENIKVVIDDVYPADTLLSNGDGYFEKTVREDEGTFYIKPDISVHNFYPRNVSTGYLESDEEYEFIKYNDLVNEWTATSVGVSRRMRDSSIYSIAMNISTDYLLSRREYNVVSDLVNQYDNYNVSITPSTIPPIQSIEITGEGNTYKGIFAVTKPSSRWELLWEVVNIEEATPPTAEDGFGSTNGGADSTYYISNFMMK